MRMKTKGNLVSEKIQKDFLCIENYQVFSAEETVGVY